MTVQGMERTGGAAGGGLDADCSSARARGPAAISISGEISDAGIEAGEEAKLEQERPRPMHSQQLGEVRINLHEALYAGAERLESAGVWCKLLLEWSRSIVARPTGQNCG